MSYLFAWNLNEYVFIIEFVKYMIVLLAVSLDGISLYRANAKKK